MPRPHLFPLLLLLPAILAAAPPPQGTPKPAAPPAGLPAPAPAPPPLTPQEVQALRDALVVRINDERAAAGAPPLHPAGALDRVAQERAEEIAKRGAMPDESESFTLFSRVQRQMAKAGYLAHGWTESATATAGDAAEVVQFWRGDPSYGDAMRGDYQDVGIGVARFSSVPLYTFLFAWPEREFFARQTAGLADLARVRAEMLARVNAERAAAGRAPLAADPRLDAAAQHHAEDMLARVYYDHRSPEGALPRQRALAAGYEAGPVGENIAAGHLSAGDAVDAWMHSSEHRRNLLDPGFTQLGVGLAVGPYEHRYKVLWVQDFARPAPAAPQSPP